MNLQESLGSDRSSSPLSSVEKRLRACTKEDQAAEDARPYSALPGLISLIPASWYTPQQYFVAWSGVLTIVYDGIPPAMEELKMRMEERFKCLAKENPGSRWPKTSLACLKDGRRLSLPQLQLLRDICREESPALADSIPVLVERLTVVLYETCCLESVLARHDVTLSRPADGRKPAETQVAYVKSVTDELDTPDIASYWFNASRDGNRTSHYRTPKLGATLVHFLANIPPSLEWFRQRVDEALPDMYDWFALDSLHITVRALT